MTNVKVSVVIPAYNEELYIAACLDSLVTQKIAEPFEVIVVDNASTDRTAEIASTYAARLHVRVIIEPHKGRGAARRAGFSRAQGDIIMSTDADSVVPPNWIETMSRPLADIRTVATTGTCYIKDLHVIRNFFFNIIQPAAMLMHRIVFGSFWMTGSNFAVKKAAYQRAGEFNAERNSQEDTELAMRIMKEGKIRLILGASVETSGRRFKRGLVRGLFSYVNNFFRHHLLGRRDLAMDDVR